MFGKYIYAAVPDRLMAKSKDFETLRSGLEAEDAIREQIIKDQRDVLKLSKKVIYSIHRGEMLAAQKDGEAMRTALQKLVYLTKKHPAMYYSGTIKTAEQEVVEALMLLHVATHKPIPTQTSLGVNKENYLLGICDLFGEITRRATNAAIRKEYGEALRMKDIAGDLYDELLRFNFRNSELRRKFDGTKYEVKKLEELALTLHLSKKV